MSLPEDVPTRVQGCAATLHEAYVGSRERVRAVVEDDVHGGIDVHLAPIPLYREEWPFSPAADARAIRSGRHRCTTDSSRPCAFRHRHTTHGYRQVGNNVAV